MGYWSRKRNDFLMSVKNLKIEEDPYIKNFNSKIAIKLIELLDNTYDWHSLNFLVTPLSIEARRKIFDQLADKVKKMDNRKKILREIHRGDFRAYTEALETFPELLPDMMKLNADLLKETISSKEIEKESLFFLRLKNIRKVLGLSKEESKIVFFYFLIGVVGANERLFEREWELDGSPRNASILAELLDVSIESVLNILGANGLLMKVGLLKKKYKGYELSESIHEYMLAGDPDKFFDLFFEKIDLDNTFEHDAKLVSMADHQIISSLLESEGSSSILLSGPPGAGKTAYGSTLAKSLGKELYAIKVESEKGDDLSARKVALMAAERIFKPDKHIILIDEADKLINQEGGGLFNLFSASNNSNEKAFINMHLSSAKNKYIYITNRTSGIDESTKRRFNYTLEFKNFDNEQRGKVWSTLIEEYNVDWLNEEELLSLSGDYELNAGSIDIALKSICQMSDLDDEEKKKRLKKILANQLEFVKGKKINPQSNMKLDLKGVIANVDLSEVVDNVKSFYRYKEEVPPEDQVVKNYNILMAGPPGVGKTTFAQILSKESGKKLIVKKYSDLQSKYVGEGEKNIARAFKEAEASDSILFIDEGDGFFKSREGASASWEITQVNQLLSEVENFNGVFLTATNFLESFDPASLRRFNEKITFKHLDETGKKHFYKLFFKQFTKDKMSNEEKVALGQIANLSVGDFKVVRDRNFFKKEVTHCELISQLKQEVSYKKENKTKISLK